MDKNPNPTPYMLSQYAAKGMSKRMIAAEFDMYEADFEKLLKKDKTLRKAYDMGEIKAETHIHKTLWEHGDTGLLLLKARMKLKLQDPVVEELAGKLFKFVLEKSDKKTQQKLATLLGIK